MEPRDADLSFQRTLLVLRRRVGWIVLCFVLATAVAFGLSKLQTKKYSATAALLFNQTSQAAELAGLSGNPLSAASQQSNQDTNVLLLRLDGVARETAAKIGHGVTPGEVAGALSISPQGDTTVVNVSATSTSPQLAATIANTYCTIFVNQQENENHQALVSTYNAIEQDLAKLSPAAKAGTEGLTLEARAAALNLLIGLPAGAVQLVSTASPPSSASSPKTKTNTVLGALLGLLIGLGVAFLLERLDQRIGEPKDLEEIYGLPLLGIVPESSTLAHTGREGMVAGLPPREAEVFHLIRAHLRYFEVDRDLRTLLISSAASGDGKTTVARSLAMAAAQMGSRVLLLEADLRRPTIAHPLGLSSGPGLADVLIGAASLSEATQLVDTDPLSRDLSRGRPLSVLVAGATPPPNPGELLESHAMERVLEQSRVAYDLVVVDTAPLTVVSDSFPLLRKVDGVIIVGRVGRERRDVAQRLRQTLASGGGPLLGVIANGVKARRNAPYGYAYDYAYAPGEGDAVTPTLS